MEDPRERARLDPAVRAVEELLGWLRSQYRDTFAGLWRNADSGSITVAMTRDADVAARELVRLFPDVAPLVGVQRRFPEERLLAVRDEVRRLLDDIAFEWNHLALDVVNNRVELGVPEPSTSASTLERRFAPELVVVAQEAVWAPSRAQAPGFGSEEPGRQGQHVEQHPLEQ